MSGQFERTGEKLAFLAERRHGVYHGAMDTVNTSFFSAAKWLGVTCWKDADGRPTGFRIGIYQPKTRTFDPDAEGHVLPLKFMEEGSTRDGTDKYAYEVREDFHCAVKDRFNNELMCSIAQHSRLFVIGPKASWKSPGFMAILDASAKEAAAIRQQSRPSAQRPAAAPQSDEAPPYGDNDTFLAERIAHHSKALKAAGMNDTEAADFAMKMAQKDVESRKVAFG